MFDDKIVELDVIREFRRALDPRWDTTHLVTGAADNTVRLWDIQTGKELNSIQTKSAVRTCGFSYSGNMVC